MSLSTIVSDLGRAQMGTAVPSTVTDDDLDACIRDLIVKDAKKRAERYGQHGIKAYLAQNLCVPLKTCSPTCLLTSFTEIAMHQSPTNGFCPLLFEAQMNTTRVS